VINILCEQLNTSAIVLSCKVGLASTVQLDLHLQRVEDDADDEQRPADDDPDPDDLACNIKQREQQQNSCDEAEVADWLLQTT